MGLDWNRITRLHSQVMTTGDSMVSKGQLMGLDWKRITQLHSQVMTVTHGGSRRVVGSNHIWGSDFLRVLQTLNLSCVCCFIFDNSLLRKIQFIVYQ